MTTDPITSFQDQYLQTWTEPAPDRRRAVIDPIWAPDGRMVVSSLGTTLEGVEDIAAHIARVHDDLIAGKGLTFTYDQHVQAGAALLLQFLVRDLRGARLLVVGTGSIQQRNEIQR